MCFLRSSPWEPCRAPVYHLLVLQTFSTRQTYEAAARPRSDRRRHPPPNPRPLWACRAPKIAVLFTDAVTPLFPGTLSSLPWPSCGAPFDTAEGWLPATVSTFAAAVRVHREEGRYENKLGFNQCRKSISRRCVCFRKIRHETGKLSFSGINPFMISLFIFYYYSRLFYEPSWRLKRSRRAENIAQMPRCVSVKRYFFFAERPLVFRAIFIKGLFGGILERLSQTTHWYSKWAPYVL